MQTRTTDQQFVRQFEERGFLVIPGALSSRQVATLSQAVDRHLDSHSDEWIKLSESMQQTVNVLPQTGDFDAAIENPVTLDILRSLLGEEITFEEFSIMI